MRTYAFCNDLKLYWATARSIGSFEDVAATFGDMCRRLGSVELISRHIAQMGIVFLAVPVGTSVGARVDVRWRLPWAPPVNTDDALP